MKVSMEFGDILKKMLGADSFGKAAMKTGISKSYWVELAQGKVPRPEALEKIIDGYKPAVSTIRALYAAAGYEVPSKYAESNKPQHKKTPEELMRDLVYEMRSSRGKCKETDDMMRKILEETLAEEALEHINGEPEL